MRFWDDTDVLACDGVDILPRKAVLPLEAVFTDAPVIEARAHRLHLTREQFRRLSPGTRRKLREGRARITEIHEDPANRICWRVPKEAITVTITYNDKTLLLKCDGVPILRERGATAGTGGKPEPPPFPIAGVGLSKRRYPPARTARTYREDEVNIGDDDLQDEDEDESRLRVRGDEDGESDEEAEANFWELMETAHDALAAALAAYRRRRATAEMSD